MKILINLHALRFPEHDFNHFAQCLTSSLHVCLRCSFMVDLARELSIASMKILISLLFHINGCLLLFSLHCLTCGAIVIIFYMVCESQLCAFNACSSKNILYSILTTTNYIILICMHFLNIK